MVIEARRWEIHKKEIPDDHYYYVRSCIRQTFFPGAEEAFLKIMRHHLNLDFYDDARHSSCSGIGYHTDLVPFETTMTIIARQFALMTERGYKHLAVSCVTSFGLYLEVIEAWEHHPHLLKQAREMLWKATQREFEIPTHIVHVSDLIYKYAETIAKLAPYKLVNIHTGKPLQVVDHVGCHYAKIFPDKGIGGSEYPKVLSHVVESFGGYSIDYPERRQCCGFGFRHYIVKENRGYSISASKRKFESMKPFKPDLIVANCPGCSMFLDKWQYALSEMEGTTYDDKNQGIPVVTHEELAAIMLGFNPWELGLQMHQVQVDSLFEKIGFKYDKSGKYLDINGITMGKPLKPSVLTVD